MLRKLPLVAAGLAALLSTAAYPADRGIIVVGQSLKDSKKALDDCIARKCAPDEEIKVAIAHAENQFVTGDYDHAMTTLNKTVSRNKKFGEQYPIEVSDLFRASSRIAEHLGNGDLFQSSVLQMRDTLKKSLGEEDARSLVAQIEVGDSRAKLGYPKEAVNVYKSVAEKAASLGKNRVATYAQLRQHLLEFAIAKNTSSKPGMEKAAIGLRAIADKPLAGAEEFALVAQVALASIDRDAGVAGSTDAIVKRFAQQGGVDRPVLLSGKPIKLPTDPRGKDALDGSGSGNVLNQLTTNMTDRWIDVGFWVNANGLVSDTEVLRKSGDSNWAKLVTDSINSRIYAPLKGKDGEASPGFYMIERYSLTAYYLDDVTGTRIKRRSPQPRIVRLDITPENYEQPKMEDIKPAS